MGLGTWDLNYFFNFFIYLPNFHFNRKVFPHSALAQNRKSFGNEVMCNFFQFWTPFSIFWLFSIKTWLLLSREPMEYKSYSFLKGLFVWQSGQPFTYTSWRTDEPNSGLDQNCYGVHTWTQDFDWNDALCSYTSYLGSRFRPLCEKGK